MKFKFTTLFLTLTLIFIISTPFSLAASSDISWSPNIRLTNHGGQDTLSVLGGALALDSENRIHVVAYYSGQIYHIYDNHGYINETVVAQVAGLEKGFDAAPSIAIDKDDVIHIAYYASDGHDYEIYYTHSTSTGGFTTPVKVTDNNVNDGYPKIAVDGTGKVHILYQTSELVTKSGPTKITLRYVQSKPGGGFTAPVNITYPVYPEMSVNQDIKIDKNNNVHIAFMAVDGYNPLTNHTVIVYTNNTSGSFSIYEVIDQTYQDFSPSIAVDDNLTVHLVFKGNGSVYSGGVRYQDLYYVNNTGGSFNTSTPVKISTVSFAHSPRIAISPNKTLNIVFYGWNCTWSENHTKVMYIKGVNGTFSTESLIPSQDLDQYLPSLAIDSDNEIHIVYMYGDLSAGAAGNVNLFYVTTASYYPIGVPEPESPTLIFLAIGIGGIAAGVIIVIVLFKRFKRLEKEVWKPRLEDDDTSVEEASST